LTKEGWQATHTLLALLFLTGGLFHILKFNWKVFVHYLKRKRTGRNYRVELAASLGVFLLVLFGTWVEIQPFSSVMAVGHTIKEMWEPEEGAAPMPHTELLSLTEVAKRLQVSSEDAVKKLEAEGVTVRDPEATLQEIARENGSSPREIYSYLTDETVQPKPTGGAITGIGRMTVADLAEAMGLETDALISRLEEMGVNADPGDNARNIAVQLEISPHDLPDRIREEK
jgi:transcriptional regulator with XRE-family HTH domain